jgi:hypothetical protein
MEVSPALKWMTHHFSCRKHPSRGMVTSLAISALVFVPFRDRSASILVGLVTEIGLVEKWLAVGSEVSDIICG